MKKSFILEFTQSCSKTKYIHEYTKYYDWSRFMCVDSMIVELKWHWLKNKIRLAIVFFETRSFW